MPNKGTLKVGWWKRFRNFIKTHINLVNIIAAALLVEVASGVMYYSAQDIIHRTVEKLIDREMNAIYLCIRNKLAQVEVAVDNMTWVVSEGLEEPEWMFDITRRMVKNNPSLWGSGIAFKPNYYPNTDKHYEPYSVRRGQDSIVTMQLGSDGVDHTMDDLHKQFGLERVESVIKQCHDLPPKEILDKVTEAVHDFVKDSEQSDDLTLLAIRYTPKHFETNKTY